MAPGPVFVSRTSDMAEYPADRSFAEAALRGIVRAERTPVDMEYFAARDREPATYCRRRVRESAVYVGIIGFRYGSLVPGTEMSYTELEFRTATEAGLPRLVFLLDEEAPIPRRLVDQDGAAIDAFRGRLRRAGFVSRQVDTPAALELAVYQALRELDAAEADDEWPTAHRAALSGRYRHLDLDVLTPAGHDDHPPMRLQSVFVPPQVRADPPRDSGSSALDVLAVSERHLVLLGDPGAGKSTLVRFVALALADDEGSLPALAGHLPIVVELGSYGRWATEGSVLDYLDREYRLAGSGIPRGRLVDYLDGGAPALVLFDGLDEVLDPQLRELVARQIVATVSRWPNLRAVVTSRTAGYRRAPLENAGFAHFVLQDFDAGRIETFVATWYARAGQPDAGHRLGKAIRSSPSLRELAGNPLLLTMLAIAGRRQELPRDRRSVYAHVASVLVEEWDGSRHLREGRVAMDHVDRDDRFALLQRVAARVQSGDRLTRADLLAEFGDYLAERYGEPPGRAKIVASALVDQFVRRSFLLRRCDDGSYGFVHRAFREYFAAAALQHRFPELCTLHWDDPAWHDVLVLLAGVVDVRVVGQVVDDLLGADPLWWLRDRPMPRPLLLAVRCLGEVRPVGRLVPQGRRVIRALMLALVHASTVGSATALADFEDGVLPVLATLGAAWPGRDEYRDWYLTHGRSLPSPTGVRVLGALCAEDETIRRFLHDLVTTSDAAELAAAAVEALADHHPHAPGWLHEQAASAHAAVRAAALRALARHWRSRAAFRTLVGHRALHDDAPLVRATAVQILGETWPDGDGLLRTVAVQDRAPLLRRAALEKLAARWADDPRTLRLLRERAVGDPHAEPRWVALAAVSRLRPRESSTLALVVDRLTFDDGPLVGRQAATILRRDWSEHADAQKALRAVPATARPVHGDGSAFTVLADDTRRDAEALAQVRSITENSRGWIAHAAVYALADRWPDDPDTLRTLTGLVETATDDDVVRTAAVTVLAERWSHDPDVRRLVLRRAVDDSAQSVRHSAVSSVARVRPDEDTRRLLLDRAANDPDDDVRLVAVQVLAARWPDEPETLRTLRERAASSAATLDGFTARQLLAAGWPGDQAAR